MLARWTFSVLSIWCTPDRSVAAAALCAQDVRPRCSSVLDPRRLPAWPLCTIRSWGSLQSAAPGLLAPSMNCLHHGEIERFSKRLEDLVHRPTLAHNR